MNTNLPSTTKEGRQLQVGLFLFFSKFYLADDLLPADLAHLLTWGSCLTNQIFTTCWLVFAVASLHATIVRRRSSTFSPHHSGQNQWQASVHSGIFVVFFVALKYGFARDAFERIWRARCWEHVWQVVEFNALCLSFITLVLD